MGRGEGGVLWCDDGDDHVIGFQAVSAVLTEPGNRCASASTRHRQQPRLTSTTSTSRPLPRHQQLMTYRSLFVAACGLHAWISFGLSREITILG